MKAVRILFILLGILVPFEAFGEPIEEIKNVVNEVRDGINGGTYSRKEGHKGDCPPYHETGSFLYADAKGTARKYYYEAGSDDSMIRWDFYYDRSGKLRFAFIRAGAANGTELEHRIYFDKKGKRIKELQKKIGGPGYTFPSTNWPDAHIVYNPGKRLKGKCSPVKG